MLTYIEEHPSVRRVLGLLLLTAGLFCLGLVLVSLVRDGTLWVFGEKSLAVVVESWAEQTSDEGAREVTFDYFVSYQFQTQDGQQITATSKVGAGEWVGVGYGQQASVRPDVLDGASQHAAAPVYQDQKHITEHTSGGIEEGSGLDIVYFPLYPDHNRLDDSRFVALLACANLPFAVVGAISMLLGWRLLRNPATVSQEGTP